MQKERIKDILLGVLLAGTFLLGFVLGDKAHFQPVLEPYSVKVDTIYHHDTITAYNPVFIDRWKVDSVFVPAIDTVTVHDTLLVLLEREALCWADSLCEVYASGILPSIDSVRHFTTTEVVYKEVVREVVKPSRFSVGVQVGYGASRDGLTPYVGLGVAYNILSF